MPRISNAIFARRLRKSQTDAEALIWRHVRGRRLAGWKFKRQVPRGRYTVDFLCVEAGLIIEIDGSQHAEHRLDYDQNRTAWLESEGYRVLRFWNSDVLQNTDGVLTEILRALPPS